MDPSEEKGTRPLDLVDYDEAAVLVDRHRNRIRAWVREGLLVSWPSEDGKSNAKRLVSKAELMKAVVVSGKSAHPGGPGRAEPAPDGGAMVALQAKVEAEQLKSASLEALLQAERQRAEALELVARAERERAEVERLRGGDWRDRATALQAELEALRKEQGLPWWRRLLS